MLCHADCRYRPRFRRRPCPPASSASPMSIRRSGRTSATPATIISCTARRAATTHRCASLTRQAAEALSRIQKVISADGLTLVVFDCYRPARAVSDMDEWTSGGGPSDPRWYPKIKRKRPHRQGLYRRTVRRTRAARPSTSRIARTDARSTPKPGMWRAPMQTTLDFGTGFDCFDRASGTAHRPLTEQSDGKPQTTCRGDARRRFQKLCRANGGTSRWKTRPYPKQRFDFPITAE